MCSFKMFLVHYWILIICCFWILSLKTNNKKKISKLSCHQFKPFFHHWYKEEYHKKMMYLLNDLVFFSPVNMLLFFCWNVLCLKAIRMVYNMCSIIVIDSKHKLIIFQAWVKIPEGLSNTYLKDKKFAE